MSKDEILRFLSDRSELFDRTTQDNPFVCSSWLVHFIEQVAGPDEIFVVAESEIGGESVMLLHGNRTTANRLSCIANYYSSLYTPLISSAIDRRPPLADVVAKLTNARPRTAIVEFAPLDSADSPMLLDALVEQGWYSRQYFRFGNWYLPASSLSFEAYMAERPSQIRNTWLRKSRKFRIEGNGRLELVTSVDETRRALDAFASIYSKSWKKPEPYAEFVPGWAEICARNGWLRMGIAWIGDVPVAAQFWFTRHGRAYIFKLAYDDEYARWSAGTLLTAFMIQYSLETDKVDEIDYLTGDDPYKKSWMSQRRERVGIRACNLSTVRGMMAGAFEKASDVRRRLRKRVPSPADNVSSEA